MFVFVYSPYQIKLLQNLQIFWKKKKTPNKINPPPPPPPRKKKKKNSTCQIFPPQKYRKSKISNPQKSFEHPHRLKSGVPPWA